MQNSFPATPQSSAEGNIALFKVFFLHNLPVKIVKADPEQSLTCMFVNVSEREGKVRRRDFCARELLVHASPSADIFSSKALQQPPKICDMH